jgi:transposase
MARFVNQVRQMNVRTFCCRSVRSRAGATMAMLSSPQVRTSKQKAAKRGPHLPNNMRGAAPIWRTFPPPGGTWRLHWPPVAEHYYHPQKMAARTSLKPRARFELPAHDHELLLAGVRRPSTIPAGRNRAKLLLALVVPGSSRRQVAKAQFVSRKAVSRAIEVYRSGGPEAVLSLAPNRPGQRPVSDKLRDETRRLAAQDNPRLSLRAIREKTGLSLDTLSRIIRSVPGRPGRGRPAKRRS